MIVDPRGYSSDELLRDGRSIRIRALRPDDERRLFAHLQDLSARSRYFRFFGARKMLRFDMMRHCTMVAMLLFGIGSASGHEPDPGPEHDEPHAPARSSPQTPLAVPSSIRTEHEHLHHQLDAAIAAGGKTGERAKAVADVLGPHFVEEEAYAMPPLGLLGALAQGEPLNDDQACQAIAMSERLRTEYDEMLREHVQIQVALSALAVAARDEHKSDHAAFAEELMRHAESEEQVLYPTTLLIGEYLKLRQAAGHCDRAGTGAAEP